MKAAAFDYATPRDLGEALAVLSAGGEEAKLMAGGQSLGPMLNLRLARPKLVVDISRTQGLGAIDVRPDGVRIGAGVTHATIEDTPLEGAHGAMLRSVAANIAYRAVRNRGTIGGSLAHADPAADWPLALAALDAVATVHGPRGVRSIAVDGLMLAAYTTQLQEDELIESVDVPALSPQGRWGYYKFCRKTGEFPDASAAVIMDPVRSVARVMIGALDGPPRRLDAIAAQLAMTGRATMEECEAAIAGAARGLSSVAIRIHTAALARAIRQVLPNFAGV